MMKAAFMSLCVVVSLGATVISSAPLGPRFEKLAAEEVRDFKATVENVQPPEEWLERQRLLEQHEGSSKQHEHHLEQQNPEDEPDVPPLDFSKQLERLPRIKVSRDPPPRIPLLWDAEDGPKSLLLSPLRERPASSAQLPDSSGWALVPSPRYGSAPPPVSPGSVGTPSPRYKTA